MIISLLTLSGLSCILTAIICQIIDTIRGKNEMAKSTILMFLISGVSFVLALICSIALNISE